MASSKYPAPNAEGDILDRPALAPPEGIVAVFDHPPNDNKLVFNVIDACIIIQILFSLTRFYARVFCVRKVRLEDCKFMGDLQILPRELMAP